VTFSNAATVMALLIGPMGEVAPSPSIRLKNSHFSAHGHALAKCFAGLEIDGGGHTFNDGRFLHLDKGIAVCNALHGSHSATSVVARADEHGVGQGF